MLEKGDLAGGTSSASTKLIHGGLRYLEQFHFGLVRKSLRERDALLNLAPHIIRPMRFIMPYVRGLRPLWMIRIGLYIYDFLAGKTTLEKSIKTDINNKKLNKNIRNGIAYSDLWVEDSRLVVLNAMDAGARGAEVRVRTACSSISRDGDAWAIQTEGRQTFHAQMVVNAAGPWAAKVLEGVAGAEDRPLRLVKGSHIIVPKIYDEGESYILQTHDGRVVFTIPYENDYTLIGTTDVDIGHDPDQKIQIESNEINYLKDIIKQYFEFSVKDSDIISTYSGVRPLMDDGSGKASEASRDYTLDLQNIEGLPLLSVLGGKLTTYRILAQEAVDMIDHLFHKTPRHWTGQEKLPGGDIEDNDVDRFVDECATDYPFLSKTLINRYARSYGTCMHIILSGAHDLSDMGADLGGGVYGRELDYLIAYEFAKTAEDVLWRRSKLGLHLDSETQKSIAKYMEERA